MIKLKEIKESKDKITLINKFLEYYILPIMENIEFTINNDGYIVKKQHKNVSLTDNKNKYYKSYKNDKEFKDKNPLEETVLFNPFSNFNHMYFIANLYKNHLVKNYMDEYVESLTMSEEDNSEKLESIIENFEDYSDDIICLSYDVKNNIYIYYFIKFRKREDEETLMACSSDNPKKALLGLLYRIFYLNNLGNKKILNTLKIDYSNINLSIDKIFNTYEYIKKMKYEIHEEEDILKNIDNKIIDVDDISPKIEENTESYIDI